MSEPTPAILEYTQPPVNGLAEADAHWLRTMSRGCVVVAVAMGIAAILLVRTPLLYFTGYYPPAVPALIYMSCDVALAAGALLAALPRPVGDSAGEDPVAFSRRIAWAGLTAVLAMHLIDVLSYNPTVAHPSTALLTAAHMIGPVMGLIGLFALMRHLRYRAAEMGYRGVASRLGLASGLYLISRGVLVTLLVTGVRYGRVGLSRQLVNRLDVAACIGVTVAAVICAAGCWSLSAAFGRTATDFPPAEAGAS